jgi:transposase
MDVSAAITQTRCSMNDKKKRREFTDEFKNDAVKLVIEQGYKASEVSRRLGVDQSNVSRWVREHRNRLESPTNTPDMEAENKRLRKENKRLQMERDILKKAAAFFANESK